MTPRSPVQVSLVLDGEDQVARLEQFRVAHPDVPVLLLGAYRPGTWRANGESDPRARSNNERPFR